jgi:hypothetical protein
MEHVAILRHATRPHLNNLRGDGIDALALVENETDSRLDSGRFLNLAQPR